MKVTMLQKILIMLLLLIAWGFVSYIYIIKPAQNDVKLAEQKLTETEAKQASVSAKIKQIDSLKEDETAMTERVASVVKIYFSINDYNDENIAAFIHNLALNSGLFITTITADGISLKNLDDMVKSAKTEGNSYIAGQLVEEFLKYAEREEEKANEPDGTTEPKAAPKSDNKAFQNAAFAYSLTIAFEDSTYEQLTAFIKGFEELGKLSIFTGVSVKTTKTESDSASTSALDGSININLMSVDSPVYIAPVFPDAKLAAPVNKNNPFKTGE